jgi:hypothetical protein
LNGAIMKLFKDYIVESSDKISYHKEKASWHADKAKQHRSIADAMSKQRKEHGTPAPTILQHGVAETGHRDAAKYHSYAASMYSMNQLDSAKEFAAQAERSSQAANNRSKSLE